MFAEITYNLYTYINTWTLCHWCFKFTWLCYNASAN